MLVVSGERRGGGRPIVIPRAPFVCSNSLSFRVNELVSSGRLLELLELLAQHARGNDIRWADWPSATLDRKTTVISLSPPPKNRTTPRNEHARILSITDFTPELFRTSEFILLPPPIHLTLSRA